MSQNELGCSKDVENENLKMQIEQMNLSEKSMMFKMKEIAKSLANNESEIAMSKVRHFN